MGTEGLPVLQTDFGLDMVLWCCLALCLAGALLTAWAVDDEDAEEDVPDADGLLANAEVSVA